MNGAAFVTEFDHEQVFELNAGANQGIINIEKTTIHGLEVEARAKPTPHLEIDASISILDSKIKNFDGTSLYRGNRAPLTPGWTSTLSVAYGFNIWGGRLSPRIEYTRRSDMYWFVDNADEQAPTDLVNATVGFERGPWRAQLWTRNLLNKAYTEEFFEQQFVGLAHDIRYPGAPRRYGLTLTYSF